MLLEGFEKRTMRDFEHQRALNHEMAGLVAFAHHSPNKIPRYKPVRTESEAADDLAQAKVRGFFMARANRGQGAQ